MSDYTYGPCQGCNGPKPAGRGRKLCDECREAPTRNATGERKCARCGEVKPAAAFGPRAKKTGADSLKSYCRPCELAKAREYRRGQPYEKVLEANRLWHSNARAEALAAYALDPSHPACACCGEDTPVFLALDHINDDGNLERYVNKGPKRRDVIRRRRAAGWPPGLQILCHNCNWAKSQGGCPHGNPAAQPARRETA